MNKPAILSFLAIASLSSSSIAYAASTGTITFEGQLTDTTCDVSVNGGGPDATVTLPTFKFLRKC